MRSRQSGQTPVTTRDTWRSGRRRKHATNCHRFRKLSSLAQVGLLRLVCPAVGDRAPEDRHHGPLDLPPAPPQHTGQPPQQGDVRGGDPPHSFTWHVTISPGTVFPRSEVRPGPGLVQGLLPPGKLLRLPLREVRHLLRRRGGPAQGSPPPAQVDKQIPGFS